ncbi:calcium-binding protein [Amaricoccus tamworthensis]|uniref:calcium-binding protein n=1 Tax=Amaricoccus tamworthensis TaxID=57002 RepID=UPI003C7C0653
MAFFTGTNGADSIEPGYVSPGVFRFPFWSTPGAANDNISGNGGNDTIDGGGGNDYIEGGSGNDILYAGTHNWGGGDTVYGGQGNDLIYSSGRGVYNGNAGNDLIWAATGTQEDLRGGTGIDTLFTTHWNFDYEINLATGLTNYVGESFTEFENLVTGDGNDVLQGTNGANTINASDGHDEISGSGGDDFLLGGNDDDTIYGGQGDDDIYGGNDDDWMHGNAGNDYIHGGSGDDTLLGGWGHDRLIGGYGADHLIGGPGDDTFDFNDTDESQPFSYDHIIGFNGAGNAPGDTIDVSGIDANTGLPGNQTFTFHGELSYAQGVALGAGALWLSNYNGDTRVQGNVDGDNWREFFLVIEDGNGIDASDYTADDFIL